MYLALFENNTNLMLQKFYILPLLFFFLISCKQETKKSDVELLKDHLKEDALNLGFRSRTDRYIISDFGKAPEYLASMNEDGSWSDIDYQDRDNNWAPLKHLDRTIVMTINYVKPSSSLFENKDLLAGIEKALSYWYTANPSCENWYKNVIAKQFYFNVIALLLQDKIDPSLHEKMVNDLTEEPSMTGSNRTLVATSTIYRGVLENNEVRIRSGVKGVTDQVIVTTKEGIQPDYSFHQHGHFIYNGSYGHNFLRESIWLATMVNGTSFAYTEEQIKTLRDYYLEGTRWMLRGGLFDFNVRGRQVGRPEGGLLSAEKIIPQLDQFIIADPEYSEAYKESKKHVESLTPQAIEGNRHFWRSDYTVHHRPQYFTSLKMCSERTVGIELNMNSENKLGYWLPYGLTYINRRGDEYQGIFPAWDWARLPGVTNPYFEYEEKGKGKAYTQKTSFVGGVSDGKYGVSAMDFSQNETSAKKSWFWFDEEWVALGAGIQSNHEAPIVTGVNQCRQIGDVIVDGRLFSNAQKTLNNPSWVMHDSVAYIFPEKQQVEIKAEIQEGNLQSIYGLGIDSVYAPQVFSLWFDHGKNPKDKSYSYMVSPGKTSEAIADYVQKLTINILSNTSLIQAVTNKGLQLTGIVFYEPGEFSDTGMSIKVNEPCLVLVDQNKGVITVSDPTAKLRNVNISIKLNSVKSQIETIELPTGGLAGSSISIDINR